MRCSTPLFLSALAVLLLGGIAVPLWRNEGLRALLAAEARATGEWMVPHLYGEPHLAKPPGMGILIALCSPFGVSAVTARLPSVLAGVALIAMAWAVFSRRFGTSAGLAAAALMPCSLLWLDRVPSAEIDLVQAAWVAGSLLCLLHAVERPGWWFGAMTCVAGGFLTKWTAPAFFYLTALAWLTPQRKLHLLLSRGHLLALAGLVLLMAGWLSAVGQSVGWATLMDALGREALMRLSPSHHPRPYPWGELATFPLSFLGGCLPAALLLPFAWKRTGDERQAALVSLCWAWLLSSLVFWTVVPGHRPRHILPAQPAVAMLAACGFLQARFSPRLLPVFLACWLGVKLGHVGLVMPRRPHAEGSAALLRTLVPEGRTLWLEGVKDEGVMFAYGRPARRGPAPPGEWCLMPGQGSDGLRDSQGSPLVLRRGKPYPPGDALTGRNER
ncbi:MAG: glycosyltransferase family 39 protein [Gemmataceae bacterium]|nr:glycosyltransferase family 39 protein [Gemmataceae bacterium]